ncbi:anaphase-promoting complex subunit cdh1-like [Anoplophora glabripennis]|uniref:anaphase-promoting complex subunit cdh1-like n=1 Tax=Anoplophora glabripennis TaxID=217634 RepID=UPI0008736D12|nr:anaphase-promoting complex subunit cdh1-like [Anoplophora glabripennis]
MKLLLVIILIFILYDFVIGKSIVKRQCNSCCNECTSNCNNCQSNCNNCQSNCNNCQNCGNSCKECSSRNCESNDTEPAPVLVPFPPAQISQQPSSSTNNTNNNYYNFTADITLTNTINTVNNISIPIHINSTNENKIFIYPSASNSSVTPVVNDKCCIVVYPRTCDVSGCYVRRQRECSSICTSDVIIIPG